MDLLGNGRNGEFHLIDAISLLYNQTDLRNRIDDLQLPVIHPRMAFITGALDKEIRLSFAQRIKGTLPEPYQPLIAEGKEKDTPDFKYTLESE